MPFFKNGETDIYYEVQGAGPPLLMIAGMSSDSKSWQFIQDYLNEDFTLITFDNRGCGRTVYSGSFQLPDIADDAAALIDHLGYARMHILGHSMGGMIAQEFAIKYPEKLKKLIIASSSSSISDKAADILDDLLQKWQEGYDMASWFKIMFNYLFTPKAFENEKFMDAAIIFALAYPYPQTLEGFTDQVQAIKGFDASDRIGKIQHPTLILSGEKDILFTPEDSRSLLGIGGPTRFVTIKEAAHSLHAEKPKDFCRELKLFLMKGENGDL